MSRRRWTRPTRLTWWSLAIAVIMTSATVAYLVAVYPTLPYGVPVRFVRGLPLIYQAKTPLTVGLPAAVQGGLLLVFGSLVLLLLWRPSPHRGSVAPDTQSEGADAARMRIAAEGVALLAAVWITVQAFGAVRLIELWHRGTGGFGQVYTIALAAAILISIAIAIRTMNLVGRERRVVPPTDPTLWRLKYLYFNPRDPALYVPTRTGVGWTLNFGRPIAILLMAALLFLGIGGPYILARYVLRLGD